MYRSVALLMNLVVLSIFPPISLAASALGGRFVGSGATTVAITQSGIGLSLQLRNTAYPRNALVLTTVRLTNHTGRTISTWDCLRSSLGAEVSQPNSVITYYPPLLEPPGAPWYGCPGEVGMAGMRRTTRIPAGQTLTQMMYVVLRALTVHGWASLMVRAGQMKPTLIQTPPVHIRETTAPGPAVRILTGRSVSARVMPVPDAGPIEYSEFTSCGDTGTNRPYKRFGHIQPVVACLGHNPTPFH